jgi:tripartite-type tricarboxylate transporter receptor subunit TctC
MHHISRFRRHALVTVALAAAGVCLGTSVQAADFPSKSLRIVVPFGPGGVADLTARLVADQLSQALGKPVVVENKPGAGGVVATEAVVRSDPDGHTMFLMSSGSAITAALFTKLPFDLEKDLTPVSTLGFFDLAVLTTPNSPFKSLGDVVAYAKANPDKLNIGSITIGSTQNLTAELFKSTAGIQAQIVPYKNTPGLIGAMRGDQINLSVEMISPTLTQIKAGALKPLAVTGTRRSVVLPDVPTATELGLTGLVSSSWNALAVPSKTPAAVVERLNQELVKILAKPEVKQKLLTLNIDARSSTPAEAAQQFASDTKRWVGVIERAGIPKK